LQTEELEQAMDGALGNPGLFGDGAHAPMGCGFGLASEYLGDQLGHRLILDRAGPAGTHLIIEPLNPIGDEAFAPFTDRMGADAKAASPQPRCWARAHRPARSLPATSVPQAANASA